MTVVGAIFSPYPNPPESFRAAVAAAEDAGLGELWIWEDCFRESAFAAASAALAWTERLRVGIGIAPMPLRNVAVTAMEIATIERMFPGRLLPGVGHGVLRWMGQAGARVASPLTLMREYVPALRRLLAGDEVTVGGRYVNLDRVRLDWPPETAPRVYAAAEGPKTLALCGEVADGAVFVSEHTPAEVGAAVAAVRAGREASGRGGMPEIVAYVDATFGTDAGGSDRMPAGTIEEVAAGVRRFADVGVDRVILLPPADAALPDYYRDAAAVGRLAGGTA